METAEIINTISRIEDRIDSDLDVLASRVIDLQAICARLEFQLHQLQTKGDDQDGSEKHHAKLDELIDDARKYMHGMMDCALVSGALSHDMEQPDSYFLARSIITIYGDERPHAPPSPSMNKEIDDLAKVL